MAKSAWKISPTFAHLASEYLGLALTKLEKEIKEKTGAMVGSTRFTQVGNEMVVGLVTNKTLPICLFPHEWTELVQGCNLKLVNVVRDTINVSGLDCPSGAIHLDQMQDCLAKRWLLAFQSWSVDNLTMGPAVIFYSMTSSRAGAEYFQVIGCEDQALLDAWASFSKTLLMDRPKLHPSTDLPGFYWFIPRCEPEKLSKREDAPVATAVTVPVEKVATTPTTAEKVTTTTASAEKTAAPTEKATPFMDELAQLYASHLTKEVDAKLHNFDHVVIHDIMNVLRSFAKDGKTGATLTAATVNDDLKFFVESGQTTHCLCHFSNLAIHLVEPLTTRLVEKVHERLPFSDRLAAKWVWA